MVFELCLSCVFIFTVMLHLPCYNFERLGCNLFAKRNSLLGGFTQFWYKCHCQQCKLTIIILNSKFLMRNGNEMVKM